LTNNPREFTKTSTFATNSIAPIFWFTEPGARTVPPSSASGVIVMSGPAAKLKLENSTKETIKEKSRKEVIFFIEIPSPRVRTFKDL
jgi:hypothetical protein